MDRPDGRCTVFSRLQHWRGQVCRVNAVGGPGGILFIGDSHVEMQKHALAALGDRYGVPVFITKQNCRIVDFGIDRNCHWSVWREIDRDIKRQHITRIVAIALWPDPFDPAAYDAAVGRLLATGAHVVLERPTPRDARLAPIYYITHKAPWGDESLYSRADEVAHQKPVNDTISGWLARDSRISVLDPEPSLCPADNCLFARNGAPLYSDTHHLTAAGVSVIAPIYDPLFAAASRERASNGASR